MRYKISTSYNWYKTDIDIMLVKTYYINGVAFTFNDLSESECQDLKIISQANVNTIYTPEFFLSQSLYLICEECHPCLFELDIENPDLLIELDY